MERDFNNNKKTITEWNIMNSLTEKKIEEGKIEKS